MERNRSAISVEKLFIELCQDYVKDIDYLGILSLFASYKDYTIAELKALWQIKDNIEYIDLAKQSFLEAFDVRKMFPSLNISDEASRNMYRYVDSLEPYNDKPRLYYLFQLAFVIAFYKRLTTRYDGKEAAFANPEELATDTGAFYFRGQTNYGFRISPSILRNLRESVYLDDNYYYDLLLGTNLERSFDRLIKRGSSHVNRYYKYAFLQHACSFSPLVDFTKSPIIATSFALSNSSRINDFRNEDSAVFRLNFIDNQESVISSKREARTFLIRSFNLKVIDTSAFKLGYPYILSKSKGSTVTVQLWSIKDLLDALTPKIKILDIPTNDRMLYQQGLFVCFYDCLCLRDYIAYELNPSFVLTKYKIAKRSKRKTLNLIYQGHREYDPEHLMNPYLFFNE